MMKKERIGAIMINKILFVGRATAETTTGWDHWAMISISEPVSALGEAKLLKGWNAVHRLEFHDIEVEMPDEPYVLLDELQAQELVNFVRSVASEVEGIIVHCRAGISRSAAVAKWIAETYEIEFNHEYPHYNKHVYRLLVEANERRKERPSCLSNYASASWKNNNQEE